MNKGQPEFLQKIKWLVSFHKLYFTMTRNPSEAIDRYDSTVQSNPITSDNYES